MKKKTKKVLYLGLAIAAVGAVALSVKRANAAEPLPAPVPPPGPAPYVPTPSPATASILAATQAVLGEGGGGAGVLSNTNMGAMWQGGYAAARYPLGMVWDGGYSAPPTAWERGRIMGLGTMGWLTDAVAANMGAMSPYQIVQNRHGYGAMGAVLGTDDTQKPNWPMAVLSGVGILAALAAYQVMR